MFNIESIKTGVTQSFWKGNLLVRKHSPEILLTAGLVGVVGTIVMASKASMKLEGVLEQSKAALESIENMASESRKVEGADDKAISAVDEIELKSKAKIYLVTGLELTKLYAPAIGMGVLSIGAILASHGVMKNRQVSLVAAYNLLKEGYDNYRARVVKELGDDVDKNFHLDLRDEKYSEKETDEEGNTKSVKKTRKVQNNGPHKSIYARYFDHTCRNFQNSALMNRAFLASQERYLNDILIIRGFVFLNEAYEALGMPWTPEGQLVGWVLRSPEQMKAEGRDGYISFDINNVYNDPARDFTNSINPAFLLDFNVDGIINDLI